ncbi:MAG TPA: RING finger protein, partial [Acidobacteriota bacterium]|nr:RING finger protein [Acidobacteriota bacterium]
NQPYSQRLMREEFEEIVQRLLDIVEIYEHQPSEHFQLHQTAGEQSCPFCRGLFDAANEVIVKCVQCGTLLHRQCWQENGQCTTWGCACVNAE